MSIYFKTVLFLIAAFLFRNVAIAQSVEYYAGSYRNGVDLMCLKISKI